MGYIASDRASRIGHYVRVEGGWREVVAHAATPWEWRLRGRVVALVVVTVVLVLVAVGSALASDGLNWFELLSVLVLVVVFPIPAIRSLRRWDAEHRGSNAVSHA
jgi:hypothetical protein